MVRAMKWLFALLLLANAALFGWMQLPQDKVGSESMSAHAPYHGEKIRLISDEEAQRQPAPAVVEPPPTQICMEWGVPHQDLERAQAALKTLQLAESDVLVRKPAEKSASYWVFIPPLKSKQDANKKVEELKALGVQDSFVMQDNNKWRYAVSLGVFSTEEAAAKYLAQVKEKGVKSAKTTPRDHEGGHASLVIKASRENLELELVKVKQNFPGSELKAAACLP